MEGCTYRCWYGQNGAPILLDAGWHGAAGSGNEVWKFAGRGRGESCCAARFDERVPTSGPFPPPEDHPLVAAAVSLTVERGGVGFGGRSEKCRR